MSILDRFAKRYSLPKNSTFRLTQEGSEKILSYRGTPQDRILTALQTNGTSDADEIAYASGLNRGQVESNVIALLQKGFVQRVGGATRLGESELGSMD